jgi:hypothetical protein
MSARRPAFRLSFIPLLVFLGISVGLSGCITMTDLESAQEVSRDVVVNLSQSDAAIEQTFVMRRAGLNSLTIWAGKDPNAPASKDKTTLPLQFDLYQYQQTTAPLFSKQIAVSSSGPQYVSLPAQKDQAGEAYLIRLSAPQGGINVFGLNADVYPQGTAFINKLPIQADIAFRATYNYGFQNTLDDLVNIFPGLWLALPLTAVLFLPGWLLLDLSGLSGRFDGGEKLALSLGLSLSAIPLLMLWTTTAGLHWNQNMVILVAVCLAAVALWRARKHRFSFHITSIGIGLSVVFLLSLGVRLAMSRDMAGPAWVDSVHHALITRLIEQNGGFPPTYSPFLDMPANQYHSGFHSALASFQWLSGLELPEAMLLFGNVLNALAVLAVYLFTTTLTRSRLAGLIAALICGLVSPMPAYYTSWGRYTELAGLLILPAAFAFTVKFFEENEEKKLDSKTLLLGCLAFTGVLLVHYRVVAFLAILLAAFIISQTPFSREKLQTYAQKGLTLAAVLVTAVFLSSLPWVLPNISRTAAFALQSVGASGGKLFADFSLPLLTSALGTYSLWAAGLGLLLGIVQRKRFPYALLLWVIGMFCLANLSVYGLPGGSFVNNTSVEISLFMPISLLGGYLVSQMIGIIRKLLPERFAPVEFLTYATAGLLVAFLGIQHLLPLLNPITELSRQGDRPAMLWIQKNIPMDETILINPFLWMTTVYAGNDGGYWITPLTGRKTIPPPIIYAFGSSQKVLQINDLCKEVVQAGSSPDKLWSLMQAQNIHYIFTGVRGGPIAVNRLAGSQHFQVIYAEQGAYMFKTIP